MLPAPPPPAMLSDSTAHMIAITIKEMGADGLKQTPLRVESNVTISALKHAYMKEVGYENDLDCNLIKRGQALQDEANLDVLDIGDGSTLFFNKVVQPVEVIPDPEQKTADVEMVSLEFGAAEKEEAEYDPAPDIRANTTRRRPGRFRSIFNRCSEVECGGADAGGCGEAMSDAWDSLWDSDINVKILIGFECSMLVLLIMSIIAMSAWTLEGIPLKSTSCLVVSRDANFSYCGPIETFSYDNVCQGNTTCWEADVEIGYQTESLGYRSLHGPQSYFCPNDFDELFIVGNSYECYYGVTTGHLLTLHTEIFEEQIQIGHDCMLAFLIVILVTMVAKCITTALDGAGDVCCYPCYFFGSLGAFATSIALLVIAGDEQGMIDYYNDNAAYWNGGQADDCCVTTTALSKSGADLVSREAQQSGDGDDAAAAVSLYCVTALTFVSVIYHFTQTQRR